MKSKMTDDDRIKKMVEAMTSETPSAPNQNRQPRDLENEFGLGAGGDINQEMQDNNAEDDEDPYGDETEQKGKSKMAPSGKGVLKNPDAGTGKGGRLFGKGRDIVRIIVRGGR